MANLIITVIAIALVAVASLMGAYYGGSAFLNNQAAANASAVLNQGQQLAGAWQAYLGDNLNTAPGSLTALTVGNYLASIPLAPAAPGGVATSAVYVAKVGSRYYAWFDVGHPASAASPTEANATECVRIQKTATGLTPASFTATAPGSIAAGGNNTFGCTYTNAAPTGGLSGSGTAPASGDYTAEYVLQ